MNLVIISILGSFPPSPTRANNHIFLILSFILISCILTHLIQLILYICTCHDPMIDLTPVHMRSELKSDFYLQILSSNYIKSDPFIFKLYKLYSYCAILVSRKK